MTNLRVKLLLAASLLLTPSLSAQSIYASLTGNVTDMSTGVISGVTITITNPDTGLRRTTTTDNLGNYLVSQLPVGSNYQISAEMEGFQSQVQDGLVLQVGQRVRVDFRMTVGMITEKVVVVAAVPLVQTETSAVGQVIDNRQIIDLPLNGRDFVQLATLIPGVSSTGSTVTSSYSVGGSGSRSNSFVLDGIDNNDQAIQAYTARTSVDTIQEFRLETNAYSSENGRWAGGQLNVSTKSGTNDFHGSVYEFLRNSALDTRNYFATSGSKPPFKRNQFGGTLGGPIKKDKLFFFIGYEGTRQRADTTQLATTLAIAYDAQGNYLSPKPIKDPSTGLNFPDNIIPADRIDPVGKNIAALYPAPNRSDPRANFISSGGNPDDVDQFSIRADYQITNKDMLFSRYSYDNQRATLSFEGATIRFPGYERLREQKAQNGVISYTRIMSNTMLNELRVGFNRMDAAYFTAPGKYKNPGEIGITGLDPRAYDGTYPGMSQFSITGYDQMGNNPLFPQNRWDTTLLAVEHLTWNRGRHAFKFGGDYNRFQVNQYVNGLVRGNFTFTGQYTGTSVADLLLGIPARTSRRLLPTTDRDYRVHTTASFFAQDDWQALPQLTVNLGIRYEIDMALYYKHGTMGAFNPKSLVVEMVKQEPALDPRNITLPFEIPVPLVEIDSNTLCRDDNNNVAPRIGLAYRPLGNNKTVVRVGYGMFYDVDSRCGDSSLLWRFTQNFNGDLKTPNLSMADPFPEALSSAAFSPNANDPDARTTAYIQRWNLTIQREIVPGMAVEVGYVGSKGTHVKASLNINQAPLGPGSVNSRRPFSSVGLLNNIGLDVYDRNSNYHALTGKIEGRLKSGLTLLTAYSFAKDIQDGARQNAYDWKSNRERTGPAQRLTVSVVYSLPFGRTHKLGGNWSGILQGILGGWQTSGIFTLQLGAPLTATIGNVDRSQTGGLADLPNLVGDPALSEPTPEMWFNTKAFELNPTGTFGNAGRGIIIGPGITTLDFSLMKVFKIQEDKNLQFRAEMFNFCNTPNFNNPNTTVTSNQFGVITSAQTGRQIQFGLRFSF
jgi:hypothetical protein